MTDSEFIVNTNFINESDGCIAHPYAIDNTVLAGTSRDQPSTATRGKHGHRKEYSWHCSFRNLDIAESHIKGNNCCQNCFHCIFCNTAWTHHQTSFKIFLSSKRLLRLTASSNFTITDATYKLIIEGYPAFTIGASDKNKIFGLGIAT